MGDMWRPETQMGSRYLDPLIGDGKLWLPEPKQWQLNVKTGEAIIENSLSSYYEQPPRKRDKHEGFRASDWWLCRGRSFRWPCQRY